jgi:hypothetical protein
MTNSDTVPGEGYTKGLSELLAKVQAASGADKELDALILCATLAPAGSKIEKSKFNGAWCIYAPATYGKEPFKAWETPAPWRMEHMRLTASIDAALALVERVLPGRWSEMLRWAMDNMWAEQAPHMLLETLPRHLVACALQALIAGSKS